MTRWRRCTARCAGGGTGGRFLSDKQGNHGFGLLRIDDIVAKHGGYLNRKTEEGVFATEVMLPMEHI